MDIKFNYNAIKELKEQIDLLITKISAEEYEIKYLGNRFDAQCSFYVADEYGSYIDGTGSSNTSSFYNNAAELLRIICDNLTNLSQIVERKISSYSQADIIAAEEINDINSILDSII